MTEITDKNRAIDLRMKGMSYTDISAALGKKISKSTMSYWFKDLVLPQRIKSKIENEIQINLVMGRAIARHNNALKRNDYLAQLRKINSHLSGIIENKDVSKVALSMLFMAEGSKRRSGVVFGNSDPYIIDLFLHLLRACYRLDEEKFRCTVQCRADQDIEELEAFWSDITSIPRNKFCKAQVDSRTIGKPTMKKGYKGVCRICYHSANISNDLSQVPRIIYRGR